MKSNLALIGKYLYLVSSWLFVAGVVYQVYLTGLAAVAHTQGWAPHIEMGYTLAIPLLFMVLAMYLGRLPYSLKAATWLLFLTYFIQVYVLLIILRRSAPSLAALHPVLALADFGLGLWLALKALALVRAPDPTLHENTDAHNQSIVQGE